MRRKILISAGDASGDRHAAELVRVLRQRMPDLEVSGLGGPRMREAGVEILADQSDLAVGGLLELTGSLRRILRVWRGLTSAVEKREFDLLILVDSGGFNLPFSRRVKRKQGIPILYYVAPQVWAWRPGRKRKLAARVDRLAVIHPFEVEVWSDTDLHAEFVGHPLADELRAFRNSVSPEAARARIGLGEGGPCMALLPGSRRNEVEYHLPIMLRAARVIHEQVPNIRFVLGLAASIDRDQVEAMVVAADLPGTLELELTEDQTLCVLRSSEAALVKPGTVTMEALLLATPMVVMGRAHPLTAAVLRRSLSVPWLAMPNLLAGEEIVPEYLQGEARPEALAEALASVLRGPERDAQLKAFEAVRDSLGEQAASEASRIVEEMLESASS
ncbi:MAG: lipid-A-disaccharide synthase [Myxococcota bacterium]|nr:lipid-A-disaccharide synthase [Myxococcota bacterium]